MTVDEALAELVRAWNAGDGAAWGAVFAEDAVFVDVVGRVQRGREVISREHQNIFETVYRGSRLEIRRLDSRPIAGDAVLVHTETTLEVPGGPRAGTWHATQTKLFQHGEIIAFHNTGQQDLADFTHWDEELAARSPQEWGERRG